jgi:hypothetical protein
VLAQKVALAHLNIWEKAFEFGEKIKSLQKVAKNSIFWENKIIMEKVTNFLVKRKQNLITIRKNPNQKQTFQTNIPNKLETIREEIQTRFKVRYHRQQPGDNNRGGLRKARNLNENRLAVVTRARFLQLVVGVIFRM